jgi:hypothetical protein
MEWKMKKWLPIGIIILLIVCAIAYTQLTIFIIQPIGMVPEGKTVVMLRGDKNLNFIDSADGICQRNSGSVSLLCRLSAMSTIVNSKILLRLPYSNTLYEISTGGRNYDR